jgi:hypothetical protein
METSQVPVMIAVKYVRWPAHGFEKLRKFAFSKPYFTETSEALAGIS